MSRVSDVNGRVADGVRAVLFDVDGTLYRQPPLRVLMAAELALDAASRPSFRRTSRLLQVLRTFRHTREVLRNRKGRPGLLEDLQYSAVAERLGIDAADVRTTVAEWILERPLKHMPRVCRASLHELLRTLAARGVQIGALSDYPVTAKLEALGVAQFFSLGLCTTDRAIDAFKPDPKGFRHACEVWGLAPQEVLYVGDRPEVDGAGAAAAGMRCVIVGRDGRSHRAGDGPVFVSAFAELQHAFGTAH